MKRNLIEIVLFCGNVLWGEEDTVGGCRRKVETFVEKTKSFSTQILQKFFNTNTPNWPKWKCIAFTEKKKNKTAKWNFSLWIVI